MLGAGVFVVFGPGYDIAGNYLTIAIALAGVIAYLNAGSIAQLASAVTRSGGAYAYAREYLNNTWGFLAGFSFLLGKIGSAAAVALTFANYLFPENSTLVGISAVMTMTVINILGINRTALGSKILGGITLLFLVVVILASFSLSPASSFSSEPFDVISIFTATAIFFFAFAGYARVATLGAEVKNSGKTIPSAIRISLFIVLVLYLALGAILPWKIGVNLETSVTPIALLGERLGFDGVWAFTAIAALGSLLALMAGMGRTAATMAEDSELPKFLMQRNRFGTPWLAELLIAAAVALLVINWDPVSAIGLSSFCILLYYAIANWAAFKQPKHLSSRPKFLNLLGLFLCLLVASTMPLSGLALAPVLLLVAVFLRWALAKLR